MFSSLKNNLYYLVGGLIQVVFALYFAVILTSKLKGRNGFRVALFLLYVLLQRGHGHHVQERIPHGIRLAEYAAGALGLESLQRAGWAIRGS